MRLGSSPKEQVMGQEEATSGGARRGLVWMLGRISSWKGLFSPGQWWSHQKTCGCGTWGHGSVVALTVLGKQLESVGGFFQPEQFCNSMTP